MRGALVGGMISIMIATIVLFSAVLPSVIQAYDNIKGNLSASERAIASLVTLFLILGIVFGIGKFFGMV